MKDLMVGKHNIDQLILSIGKELESNSVLLVTTQNPHIGKWGMARLWRSWMEPTAAYMRRNKITMPMYVGMKGDQHGEREFNANDAHEAFTVHWLGVDKDGQRLSWSKSGRDDMRAATKGERFMAMLKHEDWAVEKGIVLYKPRDSEYSALKTEHDGI